MTNWNPPPPPEITGEHVSDNDISFLLSKFSSFIKDDDDDQAVPEDADDYSPVPVTDNENSYV